MGKTQHTSEIHNENTLEISDEVKASVKKLSEEMIKVSTIVEHLDDCGNTENCDLCSNTTQHCNK